MVPVGGGHALGFSPVASVCAMTLCGVVSMEVRWLLLVNGAAFTSYAITARQVVALHLAIVTWLAGVLIQVEHRWALELHAAALSVSIELLVRIEAERHRPPSRYLPTPIATSRKDVDAASGIAPNPKRKSASDDLRLRGDARAQVR
jgi:hypothetical protein